MGKSKLKSKSKNAPMGCPSEGLEVSTKGKECLGSKRVYRQKRVETVTKIHLILVLKLVLLPPLELDGKSWFTGD